MSASLSLLLIAGALPAADPLPNLDFAAGNLSHWQGDGFQLRASGVSSREASGQALLYRTFTVPADLAAIRFTAAAARPSATRPGAILDIYLEGAERRLIPKQIRAGNSWKPAGALVPNSDGALREYQWELAGLAGQHVRIVLLDQDERPGCYVACGGFKLVLREGTSLKDFSAFMMRLATEHQLVPFARYDSKHFIALANADDEYVGHRLQNCETMYDLFFHHFRTKGFTLQEPPGKLTIAIFDSQTGFEAYLGRKMPAGVIGIFHIPTNRLVVYDYAGNHTFLETKKQGEQQARQIRHDLPRQRYLGSFSRRYADYRNDLNVTTIMHEAAHQLSFNSGLLNRDGDTPLWLVEGLATYCESTEHGSWAGIGEPNVSRAGTLASVLQKGGTFIPLRELLVSDAWLRQSQQASRAVLGYAQCWALFHLLIEERPRELRKYMADIYSRRTSEHRLLDFAECFGADLERLERPYAAYLRKVAATQARPQDR